MMLQQEVGRMKERLLIEISSLTNKAGDKILIEDTGDEQFAKINEK